MDIDKIWTTDDMEAACKEGWGLFNGGEIQRLDEEGILEDDDAALTLVMLKAKEGSSTHKKALKLHRWATAGVVQLEVADVRAVFEKATTQVEYLEALHALVVANWENVVSVKGYVTCSPETWQQICRLCQTFDEKLNTLREYPKTKLLPGGAWMNSGFSACADQELGLWECLPPKEEDIVRKSETVETGRLGKMPTPAQAAGLEPYPS